MIRIALIILVGVCLAQVTHRISNNGAAICNTLIGGFISTIPTQSMGNHSLTSDLCSITDALPQINSSIPLKLTGPLLLSFKACNSNTSTVFTYSQLTNILTSSIPTTSNINTGAAQSLSNAEWTITSSSSYFNETQNAKASITLQTNLTFVLLQNYTALVNTTSLQNITAQNITSLRNVTVQSNVTLTSTTFIPINISYTFSLSSNDPTIVVTFEAVMSSNNTSKQYMSFCSAVNQGAFTNNLTQSNLTYIPSSSQLQGSTLTFTTGNASNLLSSATNGFAIYKQSPLYYQYPSGDGDKYTTSPKHQPAILRSANALLPVGGDVAAASFCDVLPVFVGRIVHQFEIGVAKPLTANAIQSLLVTNQNVTQAPTTAPTQSPFASVNRFTDQEKSAIVDAHNRIRASVGINELVSWNTTVEDFAVTYSSKCISGGALMAHNQDRYLANYVVGENIFASTGDGTLTGVDATNNWGSEKQYYNYTTNTCQSGEQCGHYTQIVWRTSVSIGCSRVICSNILYGNTVLCNYSPGGNNGRRPY
ncbi:hypothetical protein AKO1_008303 [Acrasis kona]|uniref:SCP domain-containing protein n=1 Tax=Acrasis kona TaxID=1008807 RepID=A0AAW2YMY4_9EUKA